MDDDLKISALAPPSLILHIGPHKTGSTYLQNAFVKNRTNLAKAGIHYPNLHVNGDPGHSKLFEAIRRSDSSSAVSKLFARFDQMRKRGERVLLSSENFDRYTAHEVAALGKLIGNNVDIVYFWRKSPDIFYSWWQEDVKHGATVPFETFLYRHFSRPFESNLINPSVVLNKYEEQFGLNSIKIFDYDEILNNKSDLFGKFCDVYFPDLNLEDTNPGRVNRSLKPATVELIRLLNLVDRGRGNRQSANPRGWILRRLATKNGQDLLDACQLVENSLAAVRVSTNGTVVNFVQRKFLEKYEKTLVSGLSDRKSYEGRAAEFYVLSEDKMLNSELLEKLEYIYDRYQKDLSAVGS